MSAVPPGALASSAGSIAAEAAWRLDRSELVEIQINNGLKRFAGGAVAGGFGERLEPGEVFGLQGDEFGDGVMPALRPAAAIGRPTVAHNRRSGVAGSVERLALGAGECVVAPRLASLGHVSPLFRHV